MSIKNNQCERCRERINPDTEEILKCPTCEEMVCTVNCIAGRHVDCFQCEEQ